MKYRLAAVLALTLCSSAFCDQKDDLLQNIAAKPASNGNTYYKNQDFELSFHGDAHFSARYKKNKDYFELRNGRNTVDVLVDKNGDKIADNIVPSDSSVDQKKELSDGGVLGNYQNGLIFGNGVRFSINAKNKLNERVEYGTSAEVNLETDSARRLSTNYAYLFLDTDYGRFEAGNYKSPTDLMKIDASSIATIDGGITNSWVFSANLEGRHIGARFDSPGSSNNARNRDVQRPFYVMPYLYTSYYREYIGGGYHIKSTYYSPDYSGFKFGISYAKDETDILPFNDNKLEQKASYKDVISGGAIYSGNYENLKYKVSATGEKSLSNDTEDIYFDLNGFNLGGMLQYAGFKFAASFADVFQSGLPKNLKLDKDLKKSFDNSVDGGTKTEPGDTTYWTLGAAYEAGPGMVSITYMQSKTDPINKDSDKAHENTLSVVSLGTHYHLTGQKYKFTPYVAINFFDTEEGAISSNIEKDDNNSGYVFLAGIKVIY